MSIRLVHRRRNRPRVLPVGPPPAVVQAKPAATGYGTAYGVAYGRS